MSPTPTPAPPAPVLGDFGVTSPDPDAVQRIGDAMDALKESAEPGALDAALDGLSHTLSLTANYYADLGYVIVSVSPWLIAVFAIFAIVAFVASVIGAFIVGMNRGEKRVKPADPDPRLVERVVREEVAAKAATAGGGDR